MSNTGVPEGIHDTQLSPACHFLFANYHFITLQHIRATCGCSPAHFMRFLSHAVASGRACLIAQSPSALSRFGAPSKATDISAAPRRSPVFLSSTSAAFLPLSTQQPGAATPWLCKAPRESPGLRLPHRQPPRTLLRIQQSAVTSA